MIIHEEALNQLYDVYVRLPFCVYSYDLVFSNWLLMYLEDVEVEKLFVNMLRWLRPDGYFFFRESCYHPSGTL